LRGSATRYFADLPVHHLSTVRSSPVAPITPRREFLGVLIAPRTCWAHVVGSPSKRALWDLSMTEILAGSYEPDERGRRPPESLYGSLTMGAHLQRLGVPVARCTVERGDTRARVVARAGPEGCVPPWPALFSV
jgi:hypothetical protein